MDAKFQILAMPLTAEYSQKFTHLIDDHLMWAFTIVVVIDLIMDLIRPIYVKSANFSSWGTKSVLRNMVTYAIVAIGYPYLSIIGLETAATAFLIAFIYQYLVWIVTTWEEIGWWLPAPIVKFVKSNMSEKQLEEALNKEKEKENGK